MDLHLSTGSLCPPLQEGKVRIYSMRFCPYVQRTLLVAAAKNAPHDIVYINLKDKPEWIFEKNSGGKTPTVESAEGILTESLIIADYFDEAFPGVKLHPTNSFRKAEDRVWVENFGGIAGSSYKILYVNTPEQEIPALVQELEGLVAVYGTELRRRGTKYFAGNEHPGMMDYMIWPWFERRAAIEKMHPNAIDYNQAKEASALEPWIDRMKLDSAVSTYLLTPEIHHQYALTVKDGNPNFNMLVKG